MTLTYVKPRPECLPCLQALIHRTVSLSTADEPVRTNATRQALAILDQCFPLGMAPARISSRFLRAIHQVTGQPDPFSAFKQRELAMARKVAHHHGLKHATLPLHKAVQVAVAGNALDFFQEPESVEREFQQLDRIALAVDDVDQVVQVLRPHARVLYLADNSGEQYFDVPLLAALVQRGCHVTYVVKRQPVQNDLSLTELDREWLPHGVELLDTGGSAVGFALADWPTELQQAMSRASLVIAKGMGHYETRDDLHHHRGLLLLKAKCTPVAEDAGVPLGAFVARLVEG